MSLGSFPPISRKQLTKEQVPAVLTTKPKRGPNFRRPRKKKK